VRASYKGVIVSANRGQIPGQEVGRDIAYRKAEGEPGQGRHGARAKAIGERQNRHAPEPEGAGRRLGGERGAKEISTAPELMDQTKERLDVVDVS